MTRTQTLLLLLSQHSKACTTHMIVKFVETNSNFSQYCIHGLGCGGGCRVTVFLLVLLFLLLLVLHLATNLVWSGTSISC